LAKVLDNMTGIKMKHGYDFLSISGKIFVLAISLGAFASLAQEACEMQEPKPIKLGMSKGFKGTCPNSGDKVSCTFDSGEGWTCTGPQGEYSGSEEMNEGVQAACGCG